MARRTSRLAVKALATVLLLVVGPASADPWLQFRGDAAKTGVAAEVGTPRGTGWVFDGPSQAQFVASPVTDGVQVIGADYGGVVSSLDVSDGSLRWSYNTGDVVTATPALAGNLVLVPSGRHLICLEVQAGGSSVQAKWTFTSPARIDSSPTIADGAVFVGSDDRSVYKLDLANGSKLWNFTSRDVVKASPTVAGGIVYFGSYDATVYALADAGSAVSVKWQYDAHGSVAASAAVSGGRVFVATLNGRVMALEASDGSRVWEATLGGVIASSPAVAGDTLFVGGDTLTALEADTGKSLWNRPLTGYVRASPAVASDDALVADYGGRVFAFRANGSLVWSFDTGSAIRSSPAVGQGLAFVGNDEGRLFAVPLAAGQPPVVQALTPRQTFSGVTETFTAQATDPEGKDLFYSWDFGDGAQALGAVARHRYGAPGNYTLTVAVSDGLQSRTASTQVTVTPFSSEVAGGNSPNAGGAGLVPVLALAAAAAALAIAVVILRRRRGPRPLVQDPQGAGPPPPPPAKGPPASARGPSAAPIDARHQADLDYYASLHGAPRSPGPSKGPTRPPPPPGP
jgi:outer membrane protein assembly factor BamB